MILFLIPALFGMRFLYDYYLLLQSCATMEQKEILEELAESVGAPAR